MARIAPAGEVVETIGYNPRVTIAELLRIGRRAWREPIALDPAWDATAREDAVGCVARWAIAGVLSREPHAWRDPRAYLAARFAVPSGEALEAMQRELAAMLTDPVRANEAAHALFLLARRGERLGVARGAIVRAQLVGEIETAAAFALGAALANGEDFADLVPELVDTFHVRWESASAIGGLIDRGIDVGAHAARVVAGLWNDRDGVGARVVGQALAAGRELELSALAELLAGERAETITRALGSVRRVVEIGGDIGSLLPRIEQLAKDRRRSVAESASEVIAARAPRDATTVAFDAALQARDVTALRALAVTRHGMTALLVAANRGDLEATLATEVCVDAVASREEAIRYAAVETLALVCGACTCDLGGYVPALVAMLAHEGKGEMLFGTYRSGGPSHAAARALVHAIRWDATGGVAADLIARLGKRGGDRTRLAAGALGEGLGRAGRVADAIPLLQHDKGLVRAAALHGLALADASVPGAVLRPLRGDDDLDVSELARMIAIEGDAEDAARARAARIRSARVPFSKHELDRLEVGGDAAHVVPALVDALALPHAGRAATLLGRYAEAGAALSPHAYAIAGYWFTRPAVTSGATPLIACLRAARAQGARFDIIAELLGAHFAGGIAIELMVPDERWTDAQTSSVMQLVRVEPIGGHPSFFAEACDRAAAATEALACALETGRLAEPAS